MSDRKVTESVERSMQTVRQHMNNDAHMALIEHATKAAVQYAIDRDDEVLREWARCLLSTLRLNASPQYRAAVASLRPPDLSRPGITAAELIAALNKDSS